MQKTGELAERRHWGRGVLGCSLCNDFEDVFLFKTIGLVLVPVSRVYSHEIYLKQWLKIRRHENQTVPGHQRLLLL